MRVERARTVAERKGRKGSTFRSFDYFMPWLALVVYSHVCCFVYFMLAAL